MYCSRMATRAKAQRLITRIDRARANAGLPPATLTPETLTLQQVEAQADSLHITPESLLKPRGAAA